MPRENVEIIVCTLGTRGDILPFLALCEPLLRNGITVTVLTNRNWRTLVESIGAKFIEIADEDTPQNGRNDRDFYLKNVYPSFAKSFEIIENSAAINPQCVVIYRLNMLGAECAAEKLGLPNIKVALQPSVIPSIERPAWPLTKLAQGFWAPIFKRLLIPALLKVTEVKSRYKKYTNTFRKSVGLESVPLRRVSSCEDMLFVLCPEWFAMPQKDWPRTCRLLGFPFLDTSYSDVELEKFIGQHGAPLVFTPGTGVSEAERFFTVAESVCKSTQFPGVFLSPRARALKSPSDKIIIRDFAELSWLLPRSRLLVHHGGIGSAAQAIRAKIPQIIIPERFDQPDNALRIAMLGLGGAAFTKNIFPDELVQLISGILGNEKIRTQLEIASNLVSRQNAAEFGFESILAVIRRHFPASELSHFPHEADCETRP